MAFPASNRAHSARATIVPWAKTRLAANLLKLPLHFCISPAILVDARRIATREYEAHYLPVVK
jgi:hypothetical protein